MSVIARSYKNFPRLVELLDTRHLVIERWVSDGCITLRQAEDITSTQSDYDRNRKAIQIMMRGSTLAFQKAMVHLVESKQGHVVRLMAGDEGAASRVRMH
jgi:hypothetical protein